MGSIASMLGGIWQSVIDFFTGIFALIPQFLYFIYTCCASLFDLFQFVIRKLAGLDTYYVNGEPVSGDIISDFISGVLGTKGNVARYSSLSTVFWALVIFGCVVLVLSTIIAIIKAQYTYNASEAKKSHPMTIVFSSIKTFFLMAIIPITCIFGVYLSNVLLQALDQITSTGSTSQIESIYDNSSVNYTMYFEQGTTSTGQKAYSSFDFFGSRAYTNSPTFSSVMFKISAKNANRVRYGSYTASSSTTMGKGDDFLWSDFGIFTSTASNENVRKEDVADMIDYAFANCLTLANKDQSASLLGNESSVLISSFTYLESAVWYLGLHDVACFSKYNVGLVWYYYNLWSFNFFLGYAGVAACLIIFSTIVFGLIVRLVKLMALFLIYPALVGVGPLDNNNAIKNWQKEFIKNVLLGYGAVIGLNLSFMLLAEFQKVYFFRSAILNEVVDMLLILVVLATIGDLIKLISKVVQSDDITDVGKGTKDDLKKVGTATVSVGMKAANVALKVGTKGGFLGVAAMIAKKSSDKKKASKASSGNYPEINRLKGEESSFSNKAKEQEGIVNNQTKEVEDLFKNNKGAEGSFEARTNASDLSSRLGEPSVSSLYDDFSSKYARGARSIDSDASLTGDEKKSKKSELSDQLAADAISEFKENNTHSTSMKNFEEEAINREVQRKQLEEIQKTNEEKDNHKFVPKIKKAVLDLGGQTLKLVGKVTGIKDGWEKMKKDSSVGDDANTLAQTFFQEFSVVKQLEKIEDKSSKFLTKKQKDSNDKDETSAYRKSLEESKSRSDKFNREITNLSKEVQKMIDRGGHI